MTKLTLDNEYRALESLIEAKFPTLKVVAANPVEPTVIDTSIPIEQQTGTNTVVFEVIDTSSEELNRAVMKKLRTYQLLFYFDKQSTAMTYHSNVDAFISEIASIPCQDRHIKVDSYTMSRIFKTESGKHAFYCLVEANYHESRTFIQSPLMASLDTSISS